MHDFPNEIWIIILSFLPVTELPKLVGINRFLFHTAMEYLFSTLEYDSNSIGAVAKINSQLRYRSIASRVRTLNFNLTLTPVFSQRVLRDLTSQVSNTAHVVYNLTNLREISISISHWFPVKPFLPVLYGLVSLLRGRTLDKLRLKVEYAHTRAIFLSFVPSLVYRWTTKSISIRSLGLVFPDRFPTDDTKQYHRYIPNQEVRATYQRCIGALLNHYQSSITQLGITFPSGYLFHLIFHEQSFFDELKLSKLEIGTFYCANAQGIRSFLVSQQSTLKHLTIRYPGPAITGPDSSASAVHPHELLKLVRTVPLLNLETLDLATAWLHQDRRVPATVYLPSSPNRITSLFLEDAYYLPDGVDELLQEVTKRLPMLNHITLAICALAPKVLQTLSTRLAFPALCLHLKLPDHYEVEPYIYDQTYPRWELQQFKITRVCQQCHEDMAVEKELVDALTRCLPLIPVKSEEKCRCFASSVLRRITNAAEKA